MKKTLGVISLFVLMSVQILTPIAYAVGDEDFITEATVEETVTEDVVEATDDVEEVSEEVTEEDALEEVSEDKDSSDEDSIDEEVLDEENTETSENNDSESDDVLTGATEEDVSEKVPAVLSEEDEAFIAKLSKQSSVAKIAEKLGINWYIDSAKYAVLAGIEGDYYGTKEQNNIIREYLISHALELLKKTTPEEVVEGSVTENVVTEETVSEEVELTGLNEKEISGKKYYNGVVVNVLAPVKTFPEGTTLSIIPIKAKKELKEIKEQLVDQQEEITEESTVVAFDISFLYSGEEVQPISGQTVQVTFNYGNNETLTEANEKEEQELKVYHLNDKDEDGNKVEDISEVKVEKVETVSNEEGELVVDAESFSIYTIVTQVHDEWVLEEQLANFEYGMISIARPDSLDPSEYPELGFTVMDRNLGANTTGVGAEASTGSYGYYYQWGNNYGFSPYKDISTSLGAISVSNNEYSGSTFIIPDEPYEPWMNPVNTNLWQGESRGPCPAGWHVPTASEWSDLGLYYVRYYEEENGGEVDIDSMSDYTFIRGEGPLNGFINKFKIPFAGGLYSDASSWGPKTFVSLQSSSLVENHPEMVYYFNAYGENLYFSEGDDNGGYGFPVRCFKDTYSGTGDMFTITYDFNGGSGSTAEINVLSGEKAKQPTDPVKEDEGFIGWFLEGSNTPFDFENTSITGDITLTAKYGCENLYVDDGNQCVLDNTKVAKLKSNFRDGSPSFKTLAGSLDNIIRIIRSSDAPEGDSIDIGVGGWVPINAWFDNGTIYYYSNAEAIFFANDSAQGAFGWMKNLKVLDLSGIDTSTVTTMRQMFSEDNSLESLDLSNFDTSKVVDMSEMFMHDSALKTIYVGPNYSTGLVSSCSNMFNGVTSVKGGYGTPYMSDSFQYAVIDNESQSGYFTDQNDFLVHIYVGSSLGSTQHKSKGSTIDILPATSPAIYRYYTDSGKTIAFDPDTSLVGYTKLYANLECENGYAMNGNTCEQEYTITLNATDNGGNTETGSVANISGTVLDLTKYTASRAGYHFEGWNTDPSAQTKMGDTYTIIGNDTLYAIFSKKLTITFNTTGSSNWTSVERECTMYNNDPNCSITSPDINVVGWTAFGWSTSQNDHNNEWSRNTQKNVTASGTYYAQFFKPAETFTGNFNKNGADSVTYTSTGCSISEVWNNGVRDETCIVKAPNIVRNGWDVVGFNTDSTAHVSSLNMGDNLTLSSSNNGITYHAITKKPIIISFNANGNGGTYTPRECTIWNTFIDCNVESPVIYHSTGFEPIGWSTSSDSHVNEWPVGQSQSFSENTTYYAQTQKYITAIFSGNGNKLQGNKDQIVKTGYAYNNGTLLIDVPAIQDNEYTDVILGYSLNAASGSPIATIGGVTLSSGTIENGTAKIQRSDDVTLYAQTYKPAVTRTVTYQKGAGNDAKGVLPFTPYNDSCTIAAIYNGNNGVPQATGCELVAPEILVANDYAGYWEGPLYSGDIYTVYENKTLNAYSTGEHYSISFYLDGGTWPTNVTQQDSYQQGDTVVINAPIWTGYTFIGWTTGSNTEPVMNVSIQPTDKGAKLFVAHWQQDKYRIIYSDTVQGTTNLVKTYSYNNGSTLVAPNKSPIGYTFKGWIGENGDTPELSVTIAAGIVGDKYFTAVWEPEIYTVIGHLNGGNILGETNYVFTYDIESGNINLSTPTRDNSTFVGWTGSNGSSPDLNVVISQGSHGDKEYYAVYTCNEGYEANGNTCVLKPYSVTYVLDEGKHTTVEPKKTVTRVGTSYKINIKNPIRTGYNFLGWTTNIQNATCKEGETIRSNCRAESVNDLTIEFTEGQAVTLTAKWTHVPIEVRQQDLIGTTPTGIAVVTQYDYENGRVDLAAETMTGYKTKGWSVDTNGVVVYNDQTKEYVKDLAIAYDNPTAVSGGTGRVSLYSVRELINYDIKYLTDEGVHANPLTYNVTQQDIVLSDAEKTGYVFKGWYDVDEKKVETITSETIAELTSPYKLTLTAKWQASKNTKYYVYHERAWIDGNYYKLSGDLTDVDELTGETNTSVIAQRRTNYEGFIMPVDQQTAKIEADGSTEIIYQYEREKNTYKYNTVVGATTAWKRSIDTNYSTDSSIQQMYYETPIILSGRANTGYSWSGWDVTIGTETTRIEGINENHEHTIPMPLTNVEVTPVVYHIPYTLTYNVNGGTGNESELQEVSPIYYDSGITYPVVTRMGYTFLGWFDDNGTEDKSDDVYYGSGDNANNKKMPNGNLTLTAHWSANPFVLKVNHYQMDLTGNYPAQPKEVPINTTIDADITSGNNANILPETYTGFTLSGDAVESIHINPDGTTKIDYYYIRDKHNVTVNTNEGVTLSGTLSGSYYYQTPVSVEAIINEGYTWSGWNVTSGENEPVFTTDTGVAFILGTGNVILTPLTTTNSYHLTIKNDGTLVFSGDVLYKTNISQYLTTPSKAGYTFNGWSNRPANDLMPAKDLVIEAKWTYKSNGGGGGGGGGSSSSDDKKVIINNTGDKQQEHSSADLTGTNLTGTNKDLKENEVKEEQPEKAITDMNFDELKNLSADKLKKVDRTKLTKEENEILDAYEWAYEHNVTTMVTLNDANPEGVVTRGHLAKMVVNYAINVLGQQLPEKVPSECRWNDWRGDWESDEIKDYAVKACSLGLMGLDMKKFSPKLRVTRAQFGTIMSRLLWGKKYAGGTPYYRKHLNALKENNIMTQIGNPEGRVELRQWVWLMLMRAAMDKNA